MLNTKRIREFFPAIKSGRIVSNNAASTQIPVQLLDLMRELAVDYENVHRGQSRASIKTTEIFEDSYKTIAQFIGAPSKKNIILYRNTTEAVNSVMYSLMTEFKDGDNVVTTYMEHNSNYVPWYGMTKEILPKFGINVEYRLVRYDKETGELDMEHLESLVDDKTKIVCCTGASNFLGTKNLTKVKKIREIADKSGYIQPNGMKKSYLLMDGAQTVPNTYVNVDDLDVDFLVWSFHKMLAPFGVGALYAKEEILRDMRPFLYGGDMIEDGSVYPDRLEYNELPWKFTAGTPNILGTILSAQALRLLVDFALDSEKYFMTGKDLESSDVKAAMDNIEAHEKELVEEALKILNEIPSIEIYGPKDPSARTSLIAINCPGISPYKLAEKLNEFNVESRAGCHCASLAHRYQDMKPIIASCRLSFYVYNDLEDVRKACDAVKKCAGL